MTYQGKSKQAYIYGYAGPIDLSTYSVNKTNRIEPTLSGENRAQGTYEQYQNHDNSTELNDYLKGDTQENTDTDIGVLIREKLLGNKNASKALLITFLIIIFIISATIISDSTVEVDDVSTEDNITNEKYIKSTPRDNKLTFLDDFSLLSTPYNGLVIHWDADINPSSEIWNISTANGDNSCAEITFNNGTTYRTTIVSVEGTDNYYAEFSPLDSQQLVKNIAARSKFELCGYEFSLKGSQASIGKHPFYSRLLN